MRGGDAKWRRPAQRVSEICRAIIVGDEIVPVCWHDSSTERVRR